MRKNTIAIILAGLGIAMLDDASANELTGNRYGYPVLYHSEISSANAWWKVVSHHIKGHGKANQEDEDTTAKKPVILDVRRIEEYVAGHPVGAYNIPFPHVTGSPSKPNDSGDRYIGYDISIDPDVGFLAIDGKDGTLSIQAFVDYVESLFPDKDQPLYILCATGHRSVQAANALAKYGHYTHVRNIWEGYTGQQKYAYTGNKPSDPLIALDLNNDGVIDINDRDGWAYYQNLPIETKLVKPRLFQPYLSLYPQKGKGGKK